MCSITCSILGKKWNVGGEEIIRKCATLCLPTTRKRMGGKRAADLYGNWVSVHWINRTGTKALLMWTCSIMKAVTGCIHFIWLFGQRRESSDRFIRSHSFQRTSKLKQRLDTTTSPFHFSPCGLSWYLELQMFTWRIKANAFFFHYPLQFQVMVTVWAGCSLP